MANAIDTGSEDLQAEITGDNDHVAVLTLNRPERRNALSTGMLAGLELALIECERNPQVRCVVLTGSGRGFCAGGDLKGMADGGGDDSDRPSFDEAIALQRASQKSTTGRIYSMPKPVIASLPGAAAGAGMGLAMACDFRIGAGNAVMTTAFAKVGFSGDYGLPWLLAQQVGRAKALELFYFSDKLSAEQCMALGLFNWSVPEAQLKARTMELANRLAAGPTVAHRYIKENVNAAFSQELDDYMNGEVMRHMTASRTADHKEAVSAFLEKRAPKFQGK